MRPEDKLPSVRDFALELKINPNTVQRALKNLEDEGLVFTERTNGRYVTGDGRLIEKSRRQYAKELTREYQKNLKEIGMNF